MIDAMTGLTRLPPCPMPNDEARDWLEARHELGKVIELEPLRKDSPECVRAWIAARDRWHAARAELPIDTADSAPAFRMFGGPWIGMNAMEMPKGLGRYEYVSTLAAEAYARLSLEEFRAWAGRVYEARAMIENAHERLREALAR